MPHLCRLGCLVAFGSGLLMPNAGSAIAGAVVQIEKPAAVTDLSAARKKHARKGTGRAPRGATRDVGRDTVGSTGGGGYGVNNVSRQPNSNCVIDLGYGRSRPC